MVKKTKKIHKSSSNQSKQNIPGFAVYSYHYFHPPEWKLSSTPIRGNEEAKLWMIAAPLFNIIYKYYLWLAMNYLSSSSSRIFFFFSWFFFPPADASLSRDLKFLRWHNIWHYVPNNKDSTVPKVPLTIEDIKLRVWTPHGTIIEEDCSCDSIHVNSNGTGFGKAMRKGYHWIPTQQKKRVLRDSS